MNNVNGVQRARQRAHVLSQLQLDAVVVGAIGVEEEHRARAAARPARYTRSIGLSNRLANTAMLTTSPALGYHSQRKSAFAMRVRSRFGSPLHVVAADDVATR